jgi:hypothetical protein
MVAGLAGAKAGRLTRGELEERLSVQGRDLLRCLFQTMLAVLESVRGSFEQAVQAVERATRVTIGKRQVEQLARSAALDARGFYTARRPAASP